MMVFWERRVGLLLVLAAVAVGVYGGVSEAVVWSMPLTFVLALVGIAGLAQRERPAADFAAYLADYVGRELVRSYDGWRRRFELRPRAALDAVGASCDAIEFDWPEWRPRQRWAPPMAALVRPITARSFDELERRLGERGGRV